MTILESAKKLIDLQKKLQIVEFEEAFSKLEEAIKQAEQQKPDAWNVIDPCGNDTGWRIVPASKHHHTRRLDWMEISA